MRVCLGAKEGSETILTVAASEPILVEAAATVMQHKGFSFCCALREILTRNEQGRSGGTHCCQHYH
jgi:hypothetical protein